MQMYDFLASFRLQGNQICFSNQISKTECCLQEIKSDLCSEIIFIGRCGNKTGVSNNYDVLLSCQFVTLQVMQDKTDLSVQTEYASVEIRSESHFFFWDFLKINLDKI